MKKYIRDINRKIKQKKYIFTNPSKIVTEKNIKSYIRYAIYAVLGFFALIFALVLFYIATVPLPDISNFDKRVISQSTKIYDRTGKILLYDNHNAIRRTVVDLDQISPLIADAAISIEDDQFYNHHGVRIKSLARAFISTIFKGETQGGSTLTQQIVKNTLLTREKTLTRKIKEMIIAVRLEQKLTKNEILEIYLNEAPYSGNVYGVEEASQVYFKKKANEVNLREASYLAAIPQSPVYYDPNGAHRAELDVRANYVLKRMETLGYITKEQHEEALKTEVYFVPKAQSAVKAPHFVFWIRQYLIEKYGEEKVDQEGLRVISTLDFDLQSYAEEEALKEALKNEKEYGGSNIALVAVDPNNGQVLSMVGSRDFFDKTIDGQFNVATASRQPGSSFKPFVYATAFKKGYRPETVLFDVKTEFNASCSPDGKGTDCYSPEDFDNKWKGPMQLKNALAESRNIPAVKLLYLAGVADSISTARSMGVTTLGNPKLYGLSLVLGAGEVKPIDMASAYGTFATGGIHHETTGILKVEDKSGKVLEEWKQDEGEQVLPDYVASNISAILSNEDLRAPTFGRGSSLNVPGYSVAVKTGTTNSSRDAWIVGYSPKISIAVWSGNNNNTPMKKGGAQVSGPLFNKVIKKYLDKSGEEPFPIIPMPETGGAPILRGLWQGGESYFLDKISGGLATDFTPDEAKVEKVITNAHSILYWIDKDNPTGPSPKNPYSDPQFKNWEYSVQNWLMNNGVSGGSSRANIPNYYDTVHTGVSVIPTAINGIVDGQEINYDQVIKISVFAESQNIKNIKLFIDSREIANLTLSPYEYEIDFNKLKLKDGAHIIKAVTYDNLLYTGEDNVSFNFKNKVEPIPSEQ
jgi:1A family penicillin-binding protein